MTQYIHKGLKGECYICGIVFPHLHPDDSKPKEWVSLEDGVTTEKEDVIGVNVSGTESYKNPMRNKADATKAVEDINRFIHEHCYCKISNVSYGTGMATCCRCYSQVVAKVTIEIV